MLKRIIDLINFNLFSKLPYPYRTYYNSGRYPSIEVARLYKEVINLYVSDGCGDITISFDKLNHSEIILCNKYILLDSDSGLWHYLNNQAQSLLRINEASNYIDMETELCLMYKRYYDNNTWCFDDKKVSTFININEAIDEITYYLPSFTKMEIARHLPIWLLWFHNIQPRHLLNWLQSEYFKHYTNGVHKEERKYVIQVWDYYTSSAIHSFSGLSLKAQLN